MFFSVSTLYLLFTREYYNLLDSRIIRWYWLDHTTRLDPQAMSTIQQLSRRPAVRLTLAVAAAFTAFMMVTNWSHAAPYLPTLLPSASYRKSLGNLRGGGIRSTDPSTKVIKELKTTVVLAHRPGYTVVENL